MNYLASSLFCRCPSVLLLNQFTATTSSFFIFARNLLSKGALQSSFLSLLREMEKKSSLRRRCITWLSSSRAKNDQPPLVPPASPNQVTALAKIMETDYPASDPSADRRKYEMNMLLLFRLSVARRYHKQIPNEMNDKTQESLRRLLLFIHSISDPKRVYKGYRREEHEAFLTDLAVYWKNLPNNEEMMMYKDIWEYVAQRPLAWEGLPTWHPIGDNRPEGQKGTVSFALKNPLPGDLLAANES